MLTSRKNAQKRFCQGQSLVEFCGIAMLLILLLLGGAGYGVATYQMHMASDGMLGPVSNLDELANTSGSISSSKLLSYANGSVTSTLGGNALDSITVNLDKGYYTGTKSTLSISQWVPSIRFSMAQPIPTGFLKPISSGGALQRAANKVWVPAGDPVLTPWQGGEVGGTTTP